MPFIYLSQYGWNIPDAPTNCTCGQRFALDHALSFPACGFPSIHHNEVCDINATLLYDVCKLWKPLSTTYK
uniref:Uncharacterized protein n=1 Tax=Amphimedon queenslandica TaxID=400682 RepID=A0A1X7TL85_AMPQE